MSRGQLLEGSSNIMLFFMELLYYTILYYAILYYTILYYTILYYTILYYTILYYTILYYTILYYTIVCPVVCHYGSRDPTFTQFFAIDDCVRLRLDCFPSLGDRLKCAPPGACRELRRAPRYGISSQDSTARRVVMLELLHL